MNDETKDPSVLADVNAAVSGGVEAKAKKPRAKKVAKKVTSSATDRTTLGRLKAQTQYRVIVEESNADNSSNTVEVGVNGIVYQIMRGVEVTVPESVVKVLEQAIESRLVKDPKDPKGQRMITRSFTRHPFRVLGEAK